MLNAVGAHENLPYIPLVRRADADGLESVEVATTVTVQGVEVERGNLIDFCDFNEIGETVPLSGDHCSREGFVYVDALSAMRDEIFKKQIPPEANAVLIVDYDSEKGHYLAQPCRLARISVCPVRRI